MGEDAQAQGRPDPALPDQKITGIHAFLATSVPPKNWITDQQAPIRICVTIGHFEWQGMDDQQRKGLVDHILSHLRYDFEKETWRIEGPQFGEFPEVIERHGFWRPTKDFRRFASALGEQLALWPDEAGGQEDEEESGGETEAAGEVLQESMT